MNAWMFPTYYAEEEVPLRPRPPTEEVEIDMFFVLIGVASFLYILSVCFYLLYLASSITYIKEYYASYNHTLYCFTQCLPEK